MIFAWSLFAPFQWLADAAVHAVGWLAGLSNLFH